jgi:hypothetical protein
MIYFLLILCLLNFVFSGYCLFLFIKTRKALLEIVCPKIDLHDNQIQKLAKR